MVVLILGWLLTAAWVIAACVISQRGGPTRRDRAQEPSLKERQVSL